LLSWLGAIGLAKSVFDKKNNFCLDKLESAQATSLGVKFLLRKPIFSTSCFPIACEVLDSIFISLYTPNKWVLRGGPTSWCRAR